jgi:hypothetical protein
LFMRPVLSCVLSGLAACLTLSASSMAGTLNTADYPLRVHIFQHTGHSHYYRRTHSLELVDGEGRANLYENGFPHGFDFGYRCDERLMNSVGYETYYARWKKPGVTLDVLHPVMGKPGAADTCELKVEMKNIAYYRHNGAVEEEPEAAFKDWMDKHQYDPEKGLIEPVHTAGAPTGDGAAGSSPTGAGQSSPR